MDGTWRGWALRLGVLVVLAALWGGSYVFVRVAVGALGPLPLMALRVALAGAALVLYAAITGRRRAVRMNRRILALGALNAAIPFLLIATAQLRVEVSVAAILNATLPLFAALVDSAWSGRPIGTRRAGGLLLGVVGVALVLGWTPVAADPAWLLAAGACLLAALSYGTAGVYAARRLEGVPPLTLAIGQQLGATALLVPPALLRAPRAWPSREVVAAVLALALLSTALGFVLYFFLITAAGPVTAGSVTFLIPVFGVLWGGWLFDEPVGSGMLAGVAAILAGVFLVRDPPRPPPAPARTPRAPRRPA